MKTLNELYNKSCKLSCKNYKKITNNITLIDNFFENFELARDFFINREKWTCNTGYSGDGRHGYEILLPPWIGKSLMEKYISDNKIMDYEGSYDVVCNFFYYDFLSNLSMSNEYPHVDHVDDRYNDKIIKYVCLINLNNVSVSTKFYTYKNKEYCTNEIWDDWIKYCENVMIKMSMYSKNEKNIKISNDDLKNYLKHNNLELKSIRELEYKPNQAILYPMSLFHSPNITKEFTKDNPRILVRVGFDEKISN